MVENLVIIYKRKVKFFVLLFFRFYGKNNSSVKKEIEVDLKKNIYSEYSRVKKNMKKIESVLVKVVIFGWTLHSYQEINLLNRNKITILNVPRFPSRHPFSHSLVGEDVLTRFIYETR